MRTKTRGYGRILAFPLALQGELGQVEWAVDEPAVAGEGNKDPGPCYIRRLGALWHVRTPDGRQIAVPVVAAVVHWDDELAGYGLVKRRAPEQDEPRPAAPEPLKPVLCTYCKAPYESRIDAAVCAALDDPRVPPWPEGSDCQLCGYPLPMHAETAQPGPEAPTCVIKLPDGDLEEAERKPERYKKRQKPIGRPPCDPGQGGCGHASGAHSDQGDDPGCRATTSEASGRAVRCPCRAYKAPAPAPAPDLEAKGNALLAELLPPKRPADAAPQEAPKAGEDGPAHD